jgi:hypothetical protein
VLALVETAGFVSAYFMLQAAFGQFLLESPLQFRLTFRIAAAAWTTGRALVATDKNVLIEFRHSLNLQELPETIY